MDRAPHDSWARAIADLAAQAQADEPESPPRHRAGSPLEETPDDDDAQRRPDGLIHDDEAFWDDEDDERRAPPEKKKRAPRGRHGLLRACVVAATLGFVLGAALALWQYL